MSWCTLEELNFQGLSTGLVSAPRRLCVYDLPANFLFMHDAICLPDMRFQKILLPRMIPSTTLYHTSPVAQSALKVMEKRREFYEQLK